MTTLNPSHNIFRASQGRHAQAVHRASSSDSGPSDFPDQLPFDLDSDEGQHLSASKKGRREGRERVKAQMPPMPDLRFEQSFLLSVRPFLTPRPTKKGVAEKGPLQDDGKGSKSLVQGAEEDEVFHWGREVDVNWGMVSWITLRDQLLSPLFQGALWGWGGLLFGASRGFLRATLFPSSSVSHGHMVGGPGGSIEEAGGGSAVGGTGWWRSWVKSFGGAIETATV